MCKSELHDNNKISTFVNLLNIVLRSCHTADELGHFHQNHISFDHLSLARGAWERSQYNPVYVLHARNVRRIRLHSFSSETEDEARIQESFKPCRKRAVLTSSRLLYSSICNSVVSANLNNFSMSIL